ncbi:type I-C CRISPR-associated protein Cas8c/Csd1 [Desulforegula conservatrix]|uniref:type I-C CRISPR-associated protein Cas8c/Csd1 n=1 Tax=Desulforegula conservatrix TaxID=153026 RepID=UPI0003FE16BD|nr:type I-C CRISPR-associated protein Cas8c/Csd1 [Desulforegula conservatrix]
MIIQELDKYYKRLLLDEGSDISPLGFSSEKISFAIVIDKEGRMLRINDLREIQNKKKFPKQVVTPEAVKRTSGVSPNFMWDNSGYVLGVDSKGNAFKKFEAFRDYHHIVGGQTEDEGFQAVLKFLDSWVPEMSPDNPFITEEVLGTNLVFQLETDLKYVHERPEVKQIWLSYYNENSSFIKAQCLVCGDIKPLAQLHPPIKSVRGAQTSGAQIVSFNLSAFCSYKKEQSLNAPVSEESAFAYTTALNHLLRNESRQRIQIGDATTVFWTERESPVEDMFGNLWDSRDTGEEDNKKIKDFLEAVRDGKNLPGVDKDIGFFILGLSPNAARISIRFWMSSTVGKILDNMSLHFNDLRIEKRFDKDPDFPSVWMILKETATLGKTENISPLLSGHMMRSIISGSAYPESLLSAVITRIRAGGDINYVRASIIKGFLLRKKRFGDKNIMEVGMSLDQNSKSVAYRLGRLFAVLEKAQKDAVPGANSTIRDRYFGAASATPGAVFPQLVRLAQHHIQKSDYGFNIDKMIEEIMSEIDSFPAHLKLSQQGEFSIGYYHQRQAFFKKSTETTEA